MNEPPATGAELTPQAAALEARWGALYASLAFFIWMGFPIYFKTVAEVPATEVLAHRVCWSALFVIALLLLLRRRSGLQTIVREPRLVLWLGLSALLVSTNWLIFIWAVAHNHVLESSLGYFINPLLNVVLGVLLLRERLRRAQWIAIGIGALGVVNLIWQYGQVPWISLGLACSFGLYGLLRKRIPIDALTGLCVETVLIAPIALGYLIYLNAHGTGMFGTVRWQLDGLLMASGVLTALPLILFAAAARRLTLSTLGQLQYSVPTGHFLLAVFVFGEHFTRTHAVTFTCIWIALAVYAFDTYRAERKRRYQLG